MMDIVDRLTAEAKSNIDLHSICNEMYALSKHRKFPEIAIIFNVFAQAINGRDVILKDAIKEIKLLRNQDAKPVATSDITTTVNIKKFTKHVSYVDPDEEYFVRTSSGGWWTATWHPHDEKWYDDAGFEVNNVTHYIDLYNDLEKVKL